MSLLVYEYIIHGQLMKYTLYEYVAHTHEFISIRIHYLVEVKEFADFHLDEFEDFLIVNHVNLVQEHDEGGNTNCRGTDMASDIRTQNKSLCRFRCIYPGEPEECVHGSGAWGHQWQTPQECHHPSVQHQ